MKNTVTHQQHTLIVIGTFMLSKHKLLPNEYNYIISINTIIIIT